MFTMTIIEVSFSYSNHYKCHYFYVINDMAHFFGLFTYLLFFAYFNTERALFGIADDGLMSMVWCKHGFQRRRLNFDGKFVRFKGYGAENLARNFWRLRTAGTEKNFQAARNCWWHDGKMNRWKHIAIVFLFYIIHTQTRYYENGISLYVPNIIKIGQYLTKK